MIARGAGPAIEYAVRMREFPQEALASQLLARGAISAADIDALAAKVAEFHATLDVAPPAGPYGRPEVILRVALDNRLHEGPVVAHRRAFIPNTGVRRTWIIFALCTP